MPRSMRMWELPGDVGTFSLPGGYVAELENPSTLLAYPGNGAVVLRISSVSGDTLNGEHIAKEVIRKKAAESNQPYFEIGDKGVLYRESESENQGEALLVKQW